MDVFACVRNQRSTVKRGRWAGVAQGLFVARDIEIYLMGFDISGFQDKEDMNGRE